MLPVVQLLHQALPPTRPAGDWLLLRHAQRWFDVVDLGAGMAQLLVDLQGSGTASPGLPCCLAADAGWTTFRICSEAWIGRLVLLVASCLEASTELRCHGCNVSSSGRRPGLPVGPGIIGGRPLGPPARRRACDVAP